MAFTSQSMLSANSCSFPTHQKTPKKPPRAKGSTKFFRVNASTGSEDADCNVEECAPEKEVGKVSGEWLAGEKTKVIGTFPPRKRGWTGYVEKDTAGQTNIYSVEPAVYVADSAISSGNAGTSAQGAEKTLAISASLALISIAAASSILLQVSKNQPQEQSVVYSGPPLSYYINKFKQELAVVEASVAPELQSTPSVEASVPSESSNSPPTVEAQIPSSMQLDSDANAVPEVQVESREPAEDKSLSPSNAS
ncbi:uncharacterized protein LOC109723463 [Ananas comosus]|uniref:Uncharacterized protein LOC109723463 n=1 Tax=Ananas comosus TaxID=4615 RepID=A0A6P5GN14_ANACO|nr:uncharacterized protein LOC109723463 [Ananas comosus]